MQTKYLAQSCAELNSPASQELPFLILSNSATTQKDQYTLFTLRELYLSYQMLHFKQYQNFKILLLDSMTSFEFGLKVTFKHYKESVLSAYIFMDVFWFLISTSIMALFLRFISLHNPKVSI
jgi:hypothetical protein